MIRAIALATFVAGTLDISMAAVDTSVKGGKAGGMLRSVASGPFPGAGDWGAPGAATGLAVHFAIMAAMAALFVLAYKHIAAIRRHPLIAGAIYGLGLWLFMYGLVLPVRFGAPFPSTNPAELAKQLFAHVVLVGMTIAFITDRVWRSATNIPRAQS
ncbi:MAG: hypothetical protein ABIQ32_02990 [Sphingomicrobium sp.]